MCLTNHDLRLKQECTQPKPHSPCNLVTQRFARDDGDLLTHPLVGVEVVAQSCIVLLDDHPGGLLDRLGPDSTLEEEAHRLRFRVYELLKKEFQISSLIPPKNTVWSLKTLA